MLIDLADLSDNVFGNLLHQYSEEIPVFTISMP